jgi:hypothetical protein
LFLFPIRRLTLEQWFPLSNGKTLSCLKRLDSKGLFLSPLTLRVSCPLSAASRRSLASRRRPTRTFLVCFYDLQALSNQYHYTMSTPPPSYVSRPNTGTTLTPYLQLSHRLSLAWLAYPILSILFIVFRLILSGDAAQTAVNNAKDDMLTACQAAQEAASSTASMPRYMAIASNELVVRSTNAALDATRQALVLALTVMEAIINFVIDIYRSTLLCFLELIVRGALSLLISATQEVRGPYSISDGSCICKKWFFSLPCGSIHAMRLFVISSCCTDHRNQSTLTFHNISLLLSALS